MNNTTKASRPCGKKPSGNPGPGDDRLLRQRFPLVARPKPLCPPLTERVAEVTRLAQTAATSQDLGAAATACNRVALIASDCGLPDLAEAWCRQHFAAYWAHRPLTGATVVLALEPLVNLARLKIRAQSGADAHRLLNTLYQAVRSRTRADIASATLNFAELTDDPAAHRDAVTKLWTIQLADATRALTTAGDWQGALQHVTVHKGIGGRLLDGRQIAIITNHLTGDPLTATRLLDESVLTGPWEQVVAQALHIVLQPSRRVPPGLVEAYLGLDLSAELLPFQVRLGAAITELIRETDPNAAAAVTAHLITTAIHARNGYIARDVLTHTTSTGQLTEAQRAVLAAAMRDSFLDAMHIPTNSLDALDGARRLALNVIKDVLSHSPDGGHQRTLSRRAKTPMPPRSHLSPTQNVTNTLR